MWFDEQRDGEWRGWADRSASFDINESRSYRLEVRARGDEFSLYVDGQLIRIFTDPDHAQGRIHVRVLYRQSESDAGSCTFRDTLLYLPEQ